MGVGTEADTVASAASTAFWERHEPRLRRALMAAYGQRLLDRWLASRPGITERLSTLRDAMLQRARTILAG